MGKMSYLVTNFIKLVNVRGPPITISPIPISIPKPFIDVGNFKTMVIPIIIITNPINPLYFIDYLIKYDIKTLLNNLPPKITHFYF